MAHLQHQYYVWQQAFLWLEFFRQILPPFFESLMKLAKLLEFERLAARSLYMAWMVEKDEYVTADFTYL